jgi:hypothetical protein
MGSGQFGLEVAVRSLVDLDSCRAGAVISSSAKSGSKAKVALSRRQWLRKVGRTTVLSCLAAHGLSGCRSGGVAVPRAKAFSGPGSYAGRLRLPRALCRLPDGRLFVADMTDRIQVFDPEGKFLCLWHLPDFNVDGPTGLDTDLEGNVDVTDTHFSRVLVCDPQGRVLRQIGGIAGTAPGQFTSLRHAAVGPDGQIVAAEGGGADRIQVFSREGVPITWWGRHGAGPGEFRRPESLDLDEQGFIYVADSCNHRIQIFDLEGRFIAMWGKAGERLGELRYPYDVHVGRDGLLYVCEYGNHRIQRFRLEDGGPVDWWGGPGRAVGQLYNPWAIVTDGVGRAYVADGGNHRIQIFWV